jgi:hypothetical protein
VIDCPGDPVKEAITAAIKVIPGTVRFVLTIGLARRTQDIEGERETVEGV